MLRIAESTLITAIYSTDTSSIETLTGKQKQISQPFTVMRCKCMDGFRILSDESRFNFITDFKSGRTYSRTNPGEYVVRCRLPPVSE